MRITSPYVNIHSQESMSVIANIHMLTIPIIHVLTLTIIHMPTLPIIHVPALPINRLLREQYSLFHISRTGIRVGCLFSLFSQSQEQFFLQKCHLLKSSLGPSSGRLPEWLPERNLPRTKLSDTLTLLASLNYSSFLKLPEHQRRPGRCLRFAVTSSQVAKAVKHPIA